SYARNDSSESARAAPDPLSLDSLVDAQHRFDREHDERERCAPEPAEGRSRREGQRITVKQSRDDEHDAEGMEHVDRKTSQLEHSHHEQRERHVLGEVGVPANDPQQPLIAAVAEISSVSPALSDAPAQNQE